MLLAKCVVLNCLFVLEDGLVILAINGQIFVTIVSLCALSFVYYQPPLKLSRLPYTKNIYYSIFLGALFLLMVFLLSNTIGYYFSFAIFFVFYGLIRFLRLIWQAEFCEEQISYTQFCGMAIWLLIAIIASVFFYMGWLLGLFF